MHYSATRKHTSSVNSFSLNKLLQHAASNPVITNVLDEHRQGLRAHKAKQSKAKL